MKLLSKIILVLAVFIISSCRNFRELEFTGIRGMEVRRISTSGFDGDLLVGIKNPNRFAFRIYPSEFDVKYSGVSLGKARLAKKIRVSANKEDVYRFHISSDFEDVSLADILKVLQGATFRNELEVKGGLRAGNIFYKKTLAVDFKDRISLK